MKIESLLNKKKTEKQFLDVELSYNGGEDDVNVFLPLIKAEKEQD